MFNYNGYNRADNIQTGTIDDSLVKHQVERPLAADVAWNNTYVHHSKQLALKYCIKLKIMAEFQLNLPIYSAVSIVWVLTGILFINFRIMLL